MKQKILVVILAMVMTFLGGNVWAENSYPYKNICPGGDRYFDGDDARVCDANGENCFYKDRWRFAQCNCTSYSAYMMDSYGIDFNNTYLQSSGYKWGDGKDWGAAAERAGIEVDSTPIPGDIVYWTSGASGHVAFVEKVVYGDDMKWEKIYISQYNGDGGYDYSEEWVANTDSDGITGFIHIVAYSEGVHSLFYLDSYEMSTLCDYQTKEE